MSKTTILPHTEACPQIVVPRLSADGNDIDWEQVAIVGWEHTQLTKEDLERDADSAEYMVTPHLLYGPIWLKWAVYILPDTGMPEALRVVNSWGEDCYHHLSDVPKGPILKKLREQEARRFEATLPEDFTEVRAA